MTKSTPFGRTIQPRGMSVDENEKSELCRTKPATTRVLFVQLGLGIPPGVAFGVHTCKSLIINCP